MFHLFDEIWIAAFFVNCIRHRSKRSSHVEVLVEEEVEVMSQQLSTKKTKRTDKLLIIIHIF